MLNGTPKEMIGYTLTGGAVASTGKTTVHFPVIHRAECLFGVKGMNINKGHSDNLTAQLIGCYTLENFVNNGDAVEFVSVANCLDV